jgi:hypothetical protein
LIHDRLKIKGFKFKVISVRIDLIINYSIEVAV